MEWQKSLEKIHKCIPNDAKVPKEKTEDCFFEWISDSTDVQENVDEWLSGLKREEKDIVKALSYKEEGNLFFKKKDYPASVESYYQSAKYAPYDGDTLATAIANRSAAFFHMCRYRESIQDVQFAIAKGYPEELLPKIYLRAVHCHLKLREGKFAEEYLKTLERKVENSSVIIGAKRDDILKQINELLPVAAESQERYEYHPDLTDNGKRMNFKDMIKLNPKFRYASTAVSRSMSYTMGRNVVAAEPIKKGDILFIEKPFAWVPVKHGNNVTLCDHCCGPVNDAVFPCRGCTKATYCRMRCWRKSWDYHQWECPGHQIGLFEQIGVLHLAFKIFIMSIVTTDKVWFHYTQRLVTNIEKKSKADISSIAITSLLVANYIEKYTNIFEVVDLQTDHVDKFANPERAFTFDLSTKRGQKLYAGSTILKHALQMLSNAYAVTQLIEAVPTDRNILTESQVRVAAGVYPSASMMNHSCDPTVIHTFWKNWLIVKAIKDVKEGQEIFNCYGPYYRRASVVQRQADLSSQYCFKCRCSACTDPKLGWFVEFLNTNKCPLCSGRALELARCNVQKCMDCRTMTPTTGVEELKEATERYVKGIELTDADKWEEAIPFFEKALAVQQQYRRKYHEQIGNTLDALGKCYASMGDWINSIRYLEESLIIVNERYGSDSVEIANELNKLTDVYLQYLRQMECSKSSEYKDALAKALEHTTRALEVFDLIGLPNNERSLEMKAKKEQISEFQEELDI